MKPSLAESDPVKDALYYHVSAQKTRDEDRFQIIIICIYVRSPCFFINKVLFLFLRKGTPLYLGYCYISWNLVVASRNVMNQSHEKK